MKSGILVLFVSFWLPAALPCSAEELQKELQDFPDANLTEQQWNDRAEDARRNSEQFIAGARMRMSDLCHRTKKAQRLRINAH
jgi:hypothetical protein